MHTNKKIMAEMVLRDLSVLKLTEMNQDSLFKSFLKKTSLVAL